MAALNHVRSASEATAAVKPGVFHLLTKATFVHQNNLVFVNMHSNIKHFTLNITKANNTQIFLLD